MACGSAIERETAQRRVEAYLVEIPAAVVRRAAAHAEGVREHVTVLAGSLTVGPAAQPLLLGVGPSAQFDADVPHVYQAGAVSCRAIVTVVYPLPGGGATAFDHVLDWPADAQA